MQRIVIGMAFLAEHSKPLILWVGGVWVSAAAVADAVAEVANGALKGAEAMGNLSMTALLSLISIVLGMVIYKREKEMKEERDRMEKRQEERERQWMAALDRNSDAMDGVKDGLEGLRQETSRQTSHFEGIGRTLMEKGLNASQVPHARVTPITKRSNP